MSIALIKITDDIVAGNTINPICFQVIGPLQENSKRLLLTKPRGEDAAHSPALNMSQ